MKTLTLQIGGFSFTVTGKRDNGYDIQIERDYGWETMTAYGTLREGPSCWILDNMTFEDAHQEVMLQDFFRELLKARVQAYPEVVAYYEANQPKPEPVNGVQSILDHFKKAI